MFESVVIYRKGVFAGYYSYVWWGPFPTFPCFNGTTDCSWIVPGTISADD